MASTKHAQANIGYGCFLNFPFRQMKKPIDARKHEQANYAQELAKNKGLSHNISISHSKHFLYTDVQYKVFVISEFIV